MGAGENEHGPHGVSVYGGVYADEPLAYPVGCVWGIGTNAGDEGIDDTGWLYRLVFGDELLDGVVGGGLVGEQYGLDQVLGDVGCVEHGSGVEVDVVDVFFEEGFAGAGFLEFVGYGVSFDRVLGLDEHDKAFDQVFGV